MYNKPLVSIAMATYNGEHYVAQQLDSILNQTYKNLEIVIVDDHSNDGTYAILQEYANKYHNIILVRNIANLGVSQSFSKCLSMTNGDFIALSDQDDVWFKDKIEVLVDNIGDNMLIHSDDVVVDNNLHVLYESHFAMSKNPNWQQFNDYLVNVNVTGCTVLVSRKLLDIALPIPKEFVIHDWYLAIIAAYYNKIKLLNKPLLYYRQHNNNVSGVRKKTYQVFMKHTAIFAKCLYSLLNLEIFKGNSDIIVMHRYWQAIADRKFDKRLLASIWRNPHRIKLIVLMLILIAPPEVLSRKIYNLLRKFM
jgi:glycosyltransferase involved in cell wall biosynthesis